MKKDHRSEITALASVVHALFADFESYNKAIPQEAREALALVDDWIAGKNVTAAKLQKAANLSHQDGVRFEQREKDRATRWLRTAAGNLAWIAKADRGWQTADKSIIDAATCTLGSLGQDGNAADKKFKEIYQKALAAVPATHSQKKKKDAKEKPTVDFSKYIGAAAMKKLEKCNPVLDPKLRKDEKDLKTFLTKKTYPAHKAVLAFDARYGGLIAADGAGEEGTDWLFGAYACLKSKAHKDPRGKEDWVPVAYSPNDIIFYMDAKGMVWADDTIEGSQGKYAKNGDELVAKVFKSV